MSRRLITKRLGDIHLERGLLNRKQLDAALVHQKERGGLMGEVLIQLGFISEEEVALALTAQYGFPFLPLDSYEIDPDLMTVMSEEVARRYCVIPIDHIGNALTLAMADPSNLKAIEDIEGLTKCVVQAFVSTASDIKKAIGKYYAKSSLENPTEGPATPSVTAMPPLPPRPQPPAKSTVEG